MFSPEYRFRPRLNPRRLGVKTRIFHLGDYRRATVGEGGDVPQDYFYPNASPASVMLRQKILKKCREDIYGWLNHENGQVAIYDAVNPTASGRRSLAKEFEKHDVQVSNLDQRLIKAAFLGTNAPHRLSLSSHTSTTRRFSRRTPAMLRSHHPM